MDEIRQRDENARDAVDYVFKHLRAAEQDRNRLLHSWWPHPDEPHWWPHAMPPLQDSDHALRWKASRRTGLLEASLEPLDEIRETSGRFIEIVGEVAALAGYAYAFMHQRGGSRSADP